MNEGSVLISTHDLPRAGALRDGFKGAGYSTDLVTPGEQLSADSEAVLLLLTGGTENGPGTLLRQAREELHIPVFAISSEDELVPALRPGFDEVFPRSASVHDVVAVARRAIERRRLRSITGIVGETDAMQQVLERVIQIAPVSSTVLVTGESGTGKELIARGIHALSPRRHEPFITVNLAALSDTLIESELFGHEKGAFTGAIDARRGFFELSDKGTIFLDEVGDMPPSTQTKLLRVLEQREFHRVGAERSIKVDVRIVAATNRDLRQLVEIGEFRRDLYYRLNVLGIELPPLRERRADIPLLVESFVREVSASNDLEFPGISPEAMEILVAYTWPGNIRELRNLVESMVVLSPGGVIRPEDLPDEVRSGRGGTLLPAPIPHVVERESSTRKLRPELEFVFRTLLELRVDMDYLRREFDAYRRGASLDLGGDAIIGRVGSSGPPLGAVEVAVYPSTPDHEEVSVEIVHEPKQIEEPGVVVFRPGMTIEEMERQAIAAALHEVHGNRRKAADLLGIGERTLYRKISKYGLEA